MSTFGSNVTIKISQSVGATLTTANNTSVQTVYTAPAGTYAILNISVEGTWGSTNQSTILKVGNVTIWRMCTGSNSIGVYNVLRPNGFTEGPSDPSGGTTAIIMHDASSGTQPFGSSFISVYIPGGIALTVQKTGNPTVSVNIAGVEFINTP